tara:strand:+ start:171 stop:929 length:759 start_codon:yes stop_codon:yes gene_type:complete
MSVYSFDTEIAELVGVNAATIYHNLEFWVNKNQANNQNFKDGNYWVYNSVSAWLRLFPFMTTRSIRTALDKLVAAGLVEIGQYNSKGYDKTTWYAICQKRQVHLSEMTNPFVRNDKPIPISKPISKPLKDKHDFANQASPPIKQDYLEERTLAFDDFWKQWGDNKKMIGGSNTAPRAATKIKFLNQTFNASKVRTMGIESFNDEVELMLDLAWNAHSDIAKHDKANTESSWFNYRSMYPAKFLSNAQWRDQA